MNIKNKVGIILVNYNSSKHTIECVNSLERINYENFNIIVIDNNSNIEEKNELNCICNKAKLILNDSNIGFAGANNIGIREAIKRKCDYVLLLNNDTVVEKNFLNELIDNHNENIGICTPKIMYYQNKSIIWYAGGEIKKFKGNSLMYGLGEEDIGKYDLTKYVTFASGCCMLISKSTIEKVGLLNEDYFLYYEDTDYCQKILSSGLKILYCPKSIIYHKESVSTIKKSYIYDYYFTRNRLIFIKRNIKGIYKITAYIYGIFGRGARFIISRNNLKAYIYGVIDFFKGNYGKYIG